MIEELYPFGLTAEEETRAKKIHDESIIIDMLFQGPIGTYSFGDDFEEQSLELARKAYPNDSIKRITHMQNIIDQWFTDGKLSELYKDCWYGSGITAGNRQLSVSSRESLFDSAIAIQQEYDKKPWLIKAFKAEDIEYAKANDLKAGIVTCQETMGFGKDLSLLDKFYNFGLRAVQLSYNNHNLIGAGCMEPNNAGLSKFGMEFVKRLNELGIIVDTGHCGKQTTLDACKYSTSPVIASHTAAEEVFFHNRAKSDEEIKAIAETGGVIGVFCMPWFIAEDPQNTTLDHFLDHIDHIVKITSTEHVGIGTDWPMPQTKWMALDFKSLVAPSMGFKPGDGPSTEYVKGMKDFRSFINITRGLVKRGYGDKEISNILGGNWLRVFKQVWK